MQTNIENVEIGHRVAVRLGGDGDLYVGRVLAVESITPQSGNVELILRVRIPGEGSQWFGEGEFVGRLAERWD